MLVRFKGNYKTLFLRWSLRLLILFREQSLHYDLLEKGGEGEQQCFKCQLLYWQLTSPLANGFCLILSGSTGFTGLCLPTVQPCGRVWGRRYYGCNLHLTGMLRKSVKSVLLFLQHDHPWNREEEEGRWNLWVRTTNLVFYTLTFMASWNTGTPGWWTQAPVESKRILDTLYIGSFTVYIFF